MLQLPKLTWIRFGIWLVLGLLIYFFYGSGHSRLGKIAATAEKGARGLTLDLGGEEERTGLRPPVPATDRRWIPLAVWRARNAEAAGLAQDPPVIATRTGGSISILGTRQIASCDSSRAA